MYIINTLLGLVFPERHDYKIVRQLSEKDAENFYALTQREGWLALTSFKEPNVRACIHETKFFNNAKAMDLLSIPLSRYLHTFNQNSYLIIPIPLSKKRFKERGYNQVTVVIERLLKSHPELNLKTDLLQRVKHTNPQTSLNKSDRQTNMIGAFEVVTKYTSDITDAHIILVDDVVTTGSTLSEAKQALLHHHPASVTCLALAH